MIKQDVVDLEFQVVKTLVSSDIQENLLVADAKLGNAIKDKLSISCVSNTNVNELMRCIRTQADSLLGGLPKKELTAMALGIIQYINNSVPISKIQQRFAQTISRIAGYFFHYTF